MTFADEVEADLPELWWDTRQAVGASQPDRSGNGNTGTITGSPTLDADGLTFDGSGQWVESANIAPAAYASFCLEAVVSPDVLTPYYGSIFTSFTPTLPGAMSINCQDDSLGVLTYQGQAQDADDGLWVVPVPGGDPVAAGLQHLLLDFDGTDLTLYVDGAVYGTDSGTAFDVDFLEAAQFFLGDDVFGGDGYQGLIRHGIFYDHDLGPTRAAAHAAAALSDDPAGGLTLTNPLIFDAVREHVAVDLDFDWTDGDVRAVLLDRLTWTPDAGDAVVDTAISAGAVETSGTRQTLAAPAATVSGVDHCVYWDGNPIVYPGVLVAEDFDTLLLYRFVTDDTDSYLICVYDLAAQTGDGNNITLTPDTNGYVKV